MLNTDPVILLNIVDVAIGAELDNVSIILLRIKFLSSTRHCYNAKQCTANAALYAHTKIS